MNRYTQNLYARSVAMVQGFDGGMRRILLYWVMAASFASGIRIAGSGVAAPVDLAVQLQSWFPYVLVVGAPVASLMLAFHWFKDGRDFAQPETRLARFGQWRTVGGAEARRLPLYGVTGIMASLLLGMLLNIPVRTLEFLAAIPALPAAAPGWFGTLYTLMLADVVLLSSLYAIAFVAALRHVPLFPRLLAVIWGIDILMQIGIARYMGGVEGFPEGVAEGLHALLEGNLKKVLISMSLWTPYLLLSKRVNLTFRHRVPA